jgi:hypothetical protein
MTGTRSLADDFTGPRAYLKEGGNIEMSEPMTVNEASVKLMKAYAHDDDPKMVVVYVIDATGHPVFTALRNHAGKWAHADVTLGALADDYHLILDYDEVTALVTDARKSLSD